MLHSLGTLNFKHIYI